MVKISTLIQFTRGNDQTASKVFREIYDKYYKLVYFVLAKYLVNTSDIEDVLIESFATLFKERKKVNNIKFYLLTISKNKALNLLKKKEAEVWLDPLVIENVSYSSNSSYLEVVDELYECLSKEEADLIIEHVVEGYSLVELSKKYNVPSNTLKSKYRRALKKMNAYLGDKYEK